jgi:LPXTG-motif cell wall-anchored protein
LLGALLAILVVAVVCTAGVLTFRNDDQVAGVDATSTAIAQANATTLAQNARVTQTIAAMETEAARPTNTPTNTPVPPTATSTPTDTPVPSPTAVVEGAEATPTPNLFGTSIFQATPTAVGGGSGGSGGTGGGNLPDTGIGIGTAVAVALGLLLLLGVARRLRTE